MRRKTPRNGEENQGRRNNRSQSPTKDTKTSNTRGCDQRQVRRWLSQRTKLLIISLNITIVLCLHRAIRSQLAGHADGTNTKSSIGVSNPLNFFSGLRLPSMSKDSSLNIGYRNVTQLPAPPQPSYPWDRTIPHILWFTFKENILETQKPKHFYDNVKKTIKLYTEALDAIIDDDDDDNNLPSPKTRIEFLDDDHCLSQISLAISQIKKDYPVVSNLEKNFIAESNGAYKSDICRLAALYLHGGYYFDVDMEVIKPAVVEEFRKRRRSWKKNSRPILDSKYFYQDEVKEFINDINEEAKIKYHNYYRIIDDGNTTTLNITFLTVLNEAKDKFFQSFLASTPGHPIVEVALAIVADYYQNYEDTPPDDYREERDHEYLIGPNTLYEAYRNVTGVHPATIAEPRPPPHHHQSNSNYIFVEDTIGLPLESTHTRDREDIYEEFKINLKKNRDDLLSRLQPNVEREYVYATSHVLQELPLHEGVLPHVPRRPSKNINCNYVVVRDDDDDDVVVDDGVYFYSRIVGSTNCPVEEESPSSWRWYDGWKLLWGRFFGRDDEEEDNTCGNGHVGNKKCPDEDDCCSFFGWCGRGEGFC